jgi:hypothetical protein
MKRKHGKAQYRDLTGNKFLLLDQEMGIILQVEGSDWPSIVLLVRDTQHDKALHKRFQDLGKLLPRRGRHKVGEIGDMFTMGIRHKKNGVLCKYTTKTPETPKVSEKAMMLLSKHVQGTAFADTLQEIQQKNQEDLLFTQQPHPECVGGENGPGVTTRHQHV